MEDKVILRECDTTQGLLCDCGDKCKHTHDHDLYTRFYDALMPLLDDKENQEDEEIVDHYVSVFCTIAEDYKNQKDEHNNNQ